MKKRGPVPQEVLRTPINHINKERVSNLPRNIQKKDIGELFELWHQEVKNIRKDYHIDAREVELLRDIQHLIERKVKDK